MNVSREASSQVFCSASPEMLKNLPYTCRFAGPGLAFQDDRLAGMANVKQDLVKVRRLDEGELWKPLRHKDFFDQLFQFLSLSAQARSLVKAFVPAFFDCPLHGGGWTSVPPRLAIG